MTKRCWKTKAKEFGGLGGARERGRYVSDLAGTLGLTRAQVYRHLREGGWKSGRKLRKDAGRRKSGLEDGHVVLVAGMVERSKRSDGRIVAPVCEVVGMLSANGEIPAVSASTVGRRMREMGISKREMRMPATFRGRSTEPGQMGLMDSSTSIVWRLDDAGRFVARDTGDVMRAYKPEVAAKMKVTLKRYIYIDHGSGFFKCRYFYAAGETGIDTLRFLLEVFDEMGVPEAVYLDKGPGNKAWEVRYLLWLLGVEVKEKGKDPWPAGKVEERHKSIQDGLEWRWGIEKPLGLDAANGVARQWCQRENYQRRSGNGTTRFERLQGAGGRLRQSPGQEALCELLTQRPEQRMVDGEGLIRYGGRLFRVEDRDLCYSRQWVAYGAWTLPDLQVLVGFDADDWAVERRLIARYVGEAGETPADALRFLGEHPVGAEKPSWAKALTEAKRAAGEWLAGHELDVYADLPAAGDADVLRGVREQGAVVQMVHQERLLGPSRAIFDAIRGVRQRWGRELTAGEGETLRGWNGRAGVGVGEVEEFVAGCGVEVEKIA